MRVLRLGCGLPHSQADGGLDRIILASLDFQGTLELFHTRIRLFQGLIKFVIDEDVVLIRVLKVLDLLLQALEVYPAPLDLLVKVLDRLFELLDVVSTRFSGPLESGEVDLRGHGLSSFRLKDGKLLLLHGVVLSDLASYLLHLIPESLILVLELLDQLLHVAVLKDDVADLAILGDHIKVLKALPHGLIVLRYLHQHLLEL